MSDIATALKDAETKMNKAVEVAKDDFSAIRTGRAHPSLFNKIMVDYYGTYTSLSQLASIQVPEARMALISPNNCGNQLENRFYHDFNSDNLNLSNFFTINNNKAIFYPNSKNNKKNYYVVPRN